MEDQAIVKFALGEIKKICCRYRCIRRNQGCFQVALRGVNNNPDIVEHDQLTDDKSQIANEMRNAVWGSLFASICVDSWLIERRVNWRLIVNFHKSFFAV
jgi:hypothetical protein